ncbi:MAG: alcohol dehydrogenase catalytic domain-containing protein [Acidobacteria bacterium]|nr:alcohol dehydrogenase catalytic domain-containing protein [Acidobacteriota bacterium]
MKAVVFDRKLEVVNAPKPAFTGNESIVRLIQAGICNTDLEITRGYFGFKGVLGHEFVGRVESSRTTSLVGARVVGEINAACSRCEFCRSGWDRHCPQRSVLGILNRDGAFREYFTLPEQNLHPVPDSVSDDDAVFVEPVAAACEILDQVDIQRAEKIAVLGDGKLGLLVAMVLDQARPAAQPPVTLIGKHPEKMRLVEDLGVSTLHLRSTRTADRSYELVVEATGSPSGLDLALRLLKPRGTVVLKSTFHGRQSFDPASVVVDEITLLGSRCGRFEPALDLLAGKRIRPSRLIRDSLPLTRAPEAFRLAQSPGVLKVLLHP